MEDAASAAPLPQVPMQTATTRSNVPDNANAGCIGPAAQEAGKVEGCAGCPNRTACASGKGREVDPGEWVVDSYGWTAPAGRTSEFALRMLGGLEVMLAGGWGREPVCGGAMLCADVNNSNRFSVSCCNGSDVN